MGGGVRKTRMGFQTAGIPSRDLAGNRSDEESLMKRFLAHLRGVGRARGTHKRWWGTQGLATEGSATISKVKVTREDR